MTMKRDETPINRRSLLHAAAGGLSAFALRRSVGLSETPPGKATTLGIASFSFHVRLAAEKAGKVAHGLADPLVFLEHSRRLGAGGIQTRIPTGGAATALRAKAEEYGMFLEGSSSLPKEQRDVERFEADLRAAKAVGAKAVRVAVGGRRYEQFDSAEKFRDFADRAWKSLQLAEPAAAKHQVPLAIENHKDWRVEDLIGMLKRLDSRWVGACVDTGNSIALLEDPLEVVKALAPWARSVHLKDAAVAEYGEGFLLADVPLGEGILDLRQMVKTLKAANADLGFCLELAARDPLKVPCLTEKYWAALGDASGRDLARTLRTVRASASGKPLPEPDKLPVEERIRREEEYVTKSLAFANRSLEL